MARKNFSEKKFKREKILARKSFGKKRERERQRERERDRETDRG